MAMPWRRWTATVLASVSAARVFAAEPPPPPARESAKEFLDSQADNALASDPSQIYRKNGLRREVDIAPGLVASLDETAPTRLGTGVAVPGSAAAPGRTIGLSLRRDPWSGDLWYQRTGPGRDAGGSLGYAWSAQWQLRIDGSERRNDDEQLKRGDQYYGLRYTPAPSVAVDFDLHHAKQTVLATADQARQNFARVNAQWLPPDWPGLGLHLTLEEPVGTHDADPMMARGKVEYGADYQYQGGGPWSQSRLYVREAPRLGLLSDGAALELRAAYRHTLGVEVPDGTPGGAVYTQFQHSSLQDDRDTLWVIGARHRFDLAPRWALDANIEQATPLEGSGAVRSFSTGGKLHTSRFPRDSFSVDYALVNSALRNSYYGKLSHTARWSDSVLSAVRMSATRGQSKTSPTAATNEFSSAFALGWREPQAKRLSILGRYTWLGRASNEPDVTDRHAHIVLGYLGYLFDEADSMSWRWSRRWDHDDLYGAQGGRYTDFALARWVHNWPGRWSLSGHVARREDTVFGNENSLGLEIGYRLSSKAALALAFNPRGFNDNEISVDEKPRKGWTLRLRFSIESALSRWLDAPMPAEAPELSGPVDHTVTAP